MEWLWSRHRIHLPFVKLPKQRKLVFGVYFLSRNFCNGSFEILNVLSRHHNSLWILIRIQLIYICRFGQYQLLSPFRVLCSCCRYNCYWLLIQVICTNIPFHSIPDIKLFWYFVHDVDSMGTEGTWYQVQRIHFQLRKCWISIFVNT